MLKEIVATKNLGLFQARDLFERNCVMSFGYKLDGNGYYQETRKSAGTAKEQGDVMGYWEERTNNLVAFSHYIDPELYVEHEYT